MARQCKALVMLALAYLFIGQYAWAADGYNLRLRGYTSSSSSETFTNLQTGAVDIWFEPGQYPSYYEFSDLAAEVFYHRVGADNLAETQYRHLEYVEVDSYNNRYFYAISGAPEQISIHMPNGDVINLNAETHTRSNPYRVSMNATSEVSNSPLLKVNMPLIYLPGHLVGHFCRWAKGSGRKIGFCITDANSISPFHYPVLTSGSGHRERTPSRYTDSYHHGHDPLRVNEVIYVNY